MWRIALRVSAVLLTLHGVATIVFAFKVRGGSTTDQLAFSNHGVTFITIALLNVVAWQQPPRTRSLSRLVHAVNITVLAFCLSFALVQPEPPAFVAACLMFVLTVAAVGSDVALRRLAAAPARGTSEEHRAA